MSASYSSQHGALGEIAERQMRLWALSLEVDQRVNREHSESMLDASPKVYPFVCLSRETGAGGEEIARRVAQDLGWPLLDRELLHYVAETGNLSEMMLKYVDEAHWDWLSDMFDSTVKQRTTNHSGYVIRLGKVLMTAVSHSSAVIVGRGAQHLLPVDKSLTVRIIGSREKRVQRIEKHRGCSHSEATRFVDAKDQERDNFVKQFLHHDPADPHCYDLVINTDHVELQEASDLIISEIHHRFPLEPLAAELAQA